MCVCSLFGLCASCARLEETEPGVCVCVWEGSDQSGSVWFLRYAVRCVKNVVASFCMQHIIHPFATYRLSTLICPTLLPVHTLSIRRGKCEPEDIFVTEIKPIHPSQQNPLDAYKFTVIFPGHMLQLGDAERHRVTLQIRGRGVSELHPGTLTSTRSKKVDSWTVAPTLGCRCFELLEAETLWYTLPYILKQMRVKR